MLNSTLKLNHAFFFANELFAHGYLNLRDENEIQNTFRKFSIGMLDLLHVTKIKGDKIIEMFFK